MSTDFLGQETAQHPLQTAGRWTWLAGSIADRIGFALVFVAVAPVLSGHRVWLGLGAIVAAVGLGFVARRVIARSWWHVASSQAAMPVAWRSIRTGLTVMVAGLALMASATMTPREVVGASGVYLALGVAVAVALRCATTGSVAMARAEELVTTAGVLALSITYVVDATPVVVRVAIAGALCVGVVIAVWPKRFQQTIAEAGDPVRAWRRGTMAAVLVAIAALVVALVHLPLSLSIVPALLGLSVLVGFLVGGFAAVSYPGPEPRWALWLARKFGDDPVVQR